VATVALEEFVTTETAGGGFKLKVAEIDIFLVIEPLHCGLEPKEAQSPPQVTNVEFEFGVAVTVRGVSVATEALQVGGQDTPEEDTVPSPVPFLVTVRV
jgi:hypothetical protein